MNESYPTACEQCRGELVVFNEGSTQGTRCDLCGWSVVTTNMPGIQLDECRYEVRCRGDYWNQTQIRAVSEVTGHNFLMSRDMLQQGSTLVFSGQAKSVLRVRNILVSAGVACEITPDFCWI
jgi:hypothetical protein